MSAYELAVHIEVVSDEGVAVRVGEGCAKPFRQRSLIVGAFQIVGIIGSERHDAHLPHSRSYCGGLQVCGEEGIVAYVSRAQHEVVEVYAIAERHVPHAVHRFRHRETPQSLVSCERELTYVRHAFRYCHVRHELLVAGAIVHIELLGIAQRTGVLLVCHAVHPYREPFLQRPLVVYFFQRRARLERSVAHRLDSIAHYYSLQTAAFGERGAVYCLQSGGQPERVYLLTPSECVLAYAPEPFRKSHILQRGAILKERACQIIHL